MHRFIVFQYGKVASTTLVSALGQLEGVEAHQAHFLGPKSFNEMLTRLVTPGIGSYFFEHSLGQLSENIRIYRHLIEPMAEGERLTVISLSREPFDWFRSAITQDIEGHLQSLSAMLGRRGARTSTPEAILGSGLELVFSLINEAIGVFGSLDALCEGQRYRRLRSEMRWQSDADFQQFMFFLNIFLRPHVWFDSHLDSAFGLKLEDLGRAPWGGLYRDCDWGRLYLLRFEALAEDMAAVMREQGFDAPLDLSPENTSAEKPFRTEINAAFATEAARRLAAGCRSRTTELLGYASAATAA